MSITCFLRLSTLFLLAHIPYRSRRTMSPTLIVGFFFLSFTSYPFLNRSACFPRCVIYIYYFWSTTHPRELLYLLNNRCIDCVERYASSPVGCAAARRVHSIAFVLTISAPASSPILFSSASHFLKKALGRSIKSQNSDSHREKMGLKAHLALWLVIF